MRFSTNASQFLNCTFLIHSVVLTVTVYCVQGLFGIIKKCSLKFSRDVFYKLFILVVSVFIMFHDLTQNFYRNCTCMSAIMHYIVISNGYFSTNTFHILLSSGGYYNYTELGLHWLCLFYFIFILICIKMKITVTIESTYSKMVYIVKRVLNLHDNFLKKIMYVYVKRRITCILAGYENGS